MTGKKCLEEEIERKRKEMEDAANELGLTHPLVIRISQQLDQLHNEWNARSDMVKENRGIYLIRRYASTIPDALVGRV